MIIYLLNKLIEQLIAHLSPNWLFVSTYRPANEVERHESQVVRNRIRLIEYKARKIIIGEHK